MWTGQVGLSRVWNLTAHGELSDDDAFFDKYPPTFSAGSLP